jgi:hypothetical protein
VWRWKYGRSKRKRAEQAGHGLGFNRHERMDENEFRLVEKPGGSRRLSPLRMYRGSILRLRAEGYTLSQVCKWLRTNDVSVTIAGLSIFLIREDRKAAKQSRR